MFFEKSQAACDFALLTIHFIIEYVIILVIKKYILADIYHI